MELGRLAFLANHPVVMACAPLDGANVVDHHLVRSYFELGVLDWRTVEIDPGGVNFCLSISGWMGLFRDIGFVVDDIREPRAPALAEGVEFSVDAAWARQWPSELVWKLRKAA